MTDLRQQTNRAPVSEDEHTRVATLHAFFSTEDVDKNADVFWSGERISDVVADSVFVMLLGHVVM